MPKLQRKMVPFSSGQSRFLEAPLVRQADGELKKILPSELFTTCFHIKKENRIPNFPQVFTSLFRLLWKINKNEIVWIWFEKTFSIQNLEKWDLLIIENCNLFVLNNMFSTYCVLGRFAIKKACCRYKFGITLFMIATGFLCM